MSNTSQPLSLAVLPQAQADTERALQLSQRLALPLLDVGQSADSTAGLDALVQVSGTTLALQLCGRGAPGPVMADLGSSGMRHRRKPGNNELVGRAIGISTGFTPFVLDATAGLGRDAFVIADLGCQVLLCERHPVVGELLRAGLESATLQGDAWLQAVCHRLDFHDVDARELNPGQLEAVDVVYLDPMFPARQKSAAVKKEMALLQRLLTVDSAADAPQLLAWALDLDVRRVVVKRPARAPELGGLMPSHCIRGKAVRYDVYMRRPAT